MSEESVKGGAVAAQGIFHHANDYITIAEIKNKIKASRKYTDYLQKILLNQCQNELLYLLGKREGSENSSPLIKDEECLYIVVDLYKSNNKDELIPDYHNELVQHLIAIGYNISLTWLKKHLIPKGLLAVTT